MLLPLLLNLNMLGSGGPIVLTGQEGQGQIGVLGPNITVALVGVQGSGQIGTLAPSNTTPLVGVAAAGQIGTLNPAGADVTVALIGVSAQGQIGTLTPSGGVPVTTAPTNPGVPANPPRIRGGKGWPEEKDLEDLLEPKSKHQHNHAKEPLPAPPKHHREPEPPPKVAIKKDPEIQSLQELLGNALDKLKAVEEKPTKQLAAVPEPRVVEKEETPTVPQAPQPSSMTAEQGAALLKTMESIDSRLAQMAESGMSWEDMIIVLSAL